MAQFTNQENNEETIFVSEINSGIPLKKPYTRKDLENIYLDDSDDMDEGGNAFFSAGQIKGPDNRYSDSQRVMVSVVCQGGYDGGSIDLIDILRKTRKYLPELWDEITKESPDNIASIKLYKRK